jgi:hypothetical protein
MESAERAKALFLSELQPSQHPTPEQVAAAIEVGLRRWGNAGCVAAVAAAYGDHPDTAPTRMCWALRVLAALPHGPAVPARPAPLYRLATVTINGCP